MLTTPNFDTASSKSSTASQLLDGLGGSSRPSKGSNKSGGGGGGDKDKTDSLRSIIAEQQVRESHKHRRAKMAKKQSADLREYETSNSYMRQMPRRWAVGEVYAPHDLAPEEIKRYRRTTGRSFDVLDVLGIKPLDMYSVRMFFFPPSWFPRARLTHYDT